MKKENNKNSDYEIKENGFAVVNNMEQLERFCEDGGWDSVEQFVESFDGYIEKADDLFGKEFMVVRDRMHFSEDGWFSG